MDTAPDLRYETKHYADGTIATGIAPLPEESPVTKTTASSTPAPQGEKTEPTIMQVRALEITIGQLELHLAHERESRKQAEAALRDVKSLVDSQIAYLQALAKNNDLSDHGTGKLAAFMNMRDALAIPQEPAEPERGK